MPGARLTALLAAAGTIALGDVPPPPDTERARDSRHGDYASSWPLKLAGPLARPPVAIAEAIASALPADAAIGSVMIAPTGHLNIRLADAWLIERLRGLGSCTALETGSATEVKFAAQPTDGWVGASDAARETLDDPGFRYRYARARLASLVALARREGLTAWTEGARLDFSDPLVRELSLLAIAIDDERRFAAGRGGEGRLERYRVKLSEGVLSFTMGRPLFGSPLADAPARLGVLLAATAAWNAAEVDLGVAISGRDGPHMSKLS